MSSDLLVNNIDSDLMVLDEITEYEVIPNRNWESIINIYNQNNKPFPIPSLICSKIIQEIKDGTRVDWAFRSYGINYTAFKNRYNKSKTVIEELSILPKLTPEQWMMVETCRNDPAFILGQDIDRASVYWLNKKRKEKEELSMNADSIEKHMRMMHPDEFQEKSNDASIEVIFKIAPGLIDSI